MFSLALQYAEVSVLISRLFAQYFVSCLGPTHLAPNLGHWVILSGYDGCVGLGAHGEDFHYHGFLVLLSSDPWFTQIGVAMSGPQAFLPGV